MSFCYPSGLDDTSNSSDDDNDFPSSGLEIVCFKACSAATKISASLIGRSIELSKFPGEEFVRDMELASAFCGDILVDASKPDLSAYKSDW